MKRVPTTELLDEDAGTPAEIAASLADLRRVNRWFGGVSTTQTLVQRVAGVRELRRLSLLDVAAGASEVPQAVSRRLKGRGLDLQVTVMDRAWSHLDSNPRTVVGDARLLPFRDEAFDLVSSSLFVHHLSPEDLVRFINEALRVCRHAVLINDLIRDPLHLMLVYGGYLLYGSRLTRHDAPASVRQAYVPEEMRAILKQTAAARVEIGRYYLYRMGVIAWKAP